MSVWVPISEPYMCGSLTERTRIHAVPMKIRPANPVRTVCGSDVFLHVFGVVNEPESVIAPAWPPPSDQRCEDCASILGTKGKRLGNEMWQQAVAS